VESRGAAPSRENCIDAPWCPPKFSAAGGRAVRLGYHVWRCPRTPFAVADYALNNTARLRKVRRESRFAGPSDQPLTRGDGAIALCGSGSNAVPRDSPLAYAAFPWRPPNALVSVQWGETGGSGKRIQRKKKNGFMRGFFRRAADWGERRSKGPTQSRYGWGQVSGRPYADIRSRTAGRIFRAARGALVSMSRTDSTTHAELCPMWRVPGTAPSVRLSF